MATRAEIILAGVDRTQAAFASVSKSLDGLKTKAVSIQAGFASLGSVVGTALIAEQFRGAVDMLDRLDDLSEKTGISVEKLSELRFAGEAVGTPLESLASGIQRLSKQMASASGGNKEAIALFKTLGVEVKNTDGTLRSSEDVLGDLADRFVSYEDGAAKAALAQAIFGKSGAEMIPLLNQGRDGIAKLRIEAEQLGAIYGGDLAKQAADFNDNLTKLRLSSEAAAISIGGPLIKSLNNLLGQYIEIKKLGSVDLVVKDAFLGFLDPNFSKLSASGQGDLKRLMADRDRVAAEIQTTLSRAVGTPTGREQADIFNRPRVKELADLNRFIEVAKARQRIEAMTSINPDDGNDAVSRRFLRAGSGKAQAPIAPSGGGAGKKEKDPEATAKRLIESLDKQLEKAKELSQVEIALKEIERTRAEGGEVTEAQKQKILRTAAEIDIIKERTETEKKAAKEQEEAQRRLLAMRDEGIRVTEASLTPLEAYNKAIERLNDLRNAGHISSETFVRGVSKEGQEFADAQKKLDELNNKTDEFAKHAAENIQDSIGQGLVDILDGNFDEIGTKFLKLLRNMAAEALAANISRAMFGDLVKGGEGSGLMGQLLRSVGSSLLGGGGSGISAANQATFDTVITGLAGARADGGPVAAGRAYLVGERGQEVFVPKGDGTIIPNHELGGKGLTVNNLTNGRVDFASVDKTPSGDVLTLRQMDQIAAQFNNPNSRVSKSMSRNLAVQRRR